MLYFTRDIFGSGEARQSSPIHSTYGKQFDDETWGGERSAISNQVVGKAHFVSNKVSVGSRSPWGKVLLYCLIGDNKLTVSGHCQARGIVSSGREDPDRNRNLGSHPPNCRSKLTCRRSLVHVHCGVDGAGTQARVGDLTGCPTRLQVMHNEGLAM